MLDMYRQITIKTLANQEKKKAHIAREVGCHRNTVRNVLNRDVVKNQTRKKSSYFDQYEKQIGNWLDEKYTRQRIYEVLCDEYSVQRTYDSLCKYIQKKFPKPQCAYGVQVIEPGEEAEVDFGYLGLLPDRNGKRSKAWVFIMTLSYSRKGFYRVVRDQKVRTLTKSCELSFDLFGGVPKYLKVDNMRTAILKNQHYDLLFNQDFLEFALHYGFVIKPCTPYSPNQKGKVENAVKYLKNNFVVGRTFADGQDVDRQLYLWMTTYANQRIHGTTQKVPEDTFKNIEQKRLQQLPDNPFSFFDRGTRTVSSNCHICFGQNYYSVPSRLVGKKVTIRWNENLLRVVYEGEEVAVHKISTVSGEYITVRSHMPDHKCYSTTEYQAKYEEKMVDIGKYAHSFFKELLVKKSSYWFRTVRVILGLCKTYGNQRVDLSLKRALDFRVTDVPTIKNICEKRLYLLDQQPRLLDQRKEDEKVSEVCRSLDYYNQVTQQQR